jgi:hypothetical protein
MNIKCINSFVRVAKIQRKRDDIRNSVLLIMMNMKTTRSKKREKEREREVIHGEEF